MLNENLQRLRKEKGFTQRELGKSAKVHFNTILCIENSTIKSPSLRTLRKLADALEVTVNDLIK